MKPVSASVARKAAALVAQGRVRPLEARAFTVIGDHNTYVVTVWGAGEEDVVCTCEAGRRGESLCSHAIAALALTKVKS